MNFDYKKFIAAKIFYHKKSWRMTEKLGFIATLNFEKFSRNLKYAHCSSIIKNGGSSSSFCFKHLKLKERVSLTGDNVTMVTC